MESIQLAQMLADLSDLNAAQESRAAVAFVNASKTIAHPPTSTTASSTAATQTPSTRLELPQPRNHHRVQSASSIISRTASPAKFDMKGRRLMTPPLSRTHSAQGSHSDVPPRNDFSTPELAGDVDRATSLMQLYEIRAKLKQQDGTSLNKLREKIASLQARQQQQAEQQKRENDSRPSTASASSKYTYPK